MSEISRKLDITCNQCNTRFIADVYEGRTIYLGEDQYPNLSFSLIQCSTCNIPLLVEQDVEYDLDRIGHGPAKLIFPITRFNIDTAIPKFIKVALEEAIICYRAKAYTASAIMCRKVLEGVCNHFNMKGGSLADRLRKMRSDGIIDNTLTEWSEVLKAAGNEAAHDVQMQVNHNDAKDLLEFAIAINDYLFSFRKKFESFKARISKRQISSDKQESIKKAESAEGV
ncbi:MAG: DUF4145 domain-containing protein [Geminicoccaceae bacterium]|nr:DUF4145 domain-containing protein [Geminicoccaceae bacterium]